MADELNPEFDVVIIGAGIAGCLAAYALAKNNAGLNPKILILEAGGFAPDRDSMYEIYARNPYKGQASPYSPDFAAPEPRQNLAGILYLPRRCRRQSRPVPLVRELLPAACRRLRVALAGPSPQDGTE
jgi:glycine/D-amino acid oxidase-like deaminating enzyme